MLFWKMLGYSQITNLMANFFVQMCCADLILSDDADFLKWKLIRTVQFTVQSMCDV